ncbi:MAG: response regulator transcription factor [Chloroflexota bacterium]|nr:response regulator transcription factor [Chloroflexota bacterium]
MSDPDRIKVMVADDHSLFRMGLRELLKTDEQVELVTEAASGDEALEKARSFRPDVVVMDVRMPRVDGIEATRQITHELPGTHVIMVSAVADDEKILEALGAGATGYLLKDEDPTQMLEAIHSASEGNAYLPPSVAKRILHRVSETYVGKGVESRGGRPPRSRPDRLTEREIVVLRLLAEGKRNREIAAALRISERTVGNHIANIYSKLGISDRAQAILYAIRHGIVKP